MPAPDEIRELEIRFGTGILVKLGGAGLIAETEPPYRFRYNLSSGDIHLRVLAISPIVDDLAHAAVIGKTVARFDAVAKQMIIHDLDKPLVILLVPGPLDPRAVER